MEQYRIIEEYVGDVTTPTAYQHVEKALKALLPIASALEPETLLPVLQRCATHPNRFVREGLFEVVSAVLAASPQTFGDLADVVRLLHRGLADNWSQVRYAASRATRTFLTETSNNPKQWHSELLPPLCLNRHYIADGVRNYTLETWKGVVGPYGRDLIAHHMEHFVAYYALQADADNHAVREAACQCICEIAMRIDKTAVRPFVPRLIATLLTAFNDESWPVRDVACLSSAAFVKEFPAECEVYLETLYPMWLYQCGDPIPSVRSHAATALGNVLAAYGAPARAFLTPHMEEMLHAVESQKSETSSSGANGYSNVTTFAVAKRVHDRPLLSMPR